MARLCPLGGRTSSEKRPWRMRSIRRGKSAKGPDLARQLNSAMGGLSDAGNLRRSSAAASSTSKTRLARFLLFFKQSKVNLITEKDQATGSHRSHQSIFSQHTSQESCRISGLEFRSTKSTRFSFTLGHSESVML